jgi:hypothetical protein
MIQAIIDAESGRAAEERSGYRLTRDAVLLLLEDGTARLLDFGGEFYALSHTAADMLSRVLQGDVALAAQQIAEDYRIAPQEAQADLVAFLQELEQRRLIDHVETGAAAYGHRMRGAGAILPPLLRGIHAVPISLTGRARALLTLAYASIRCFGWPTTLRVCQHYYGRPKLQTQPSGLCDEAVVREIEGVVRATAARHLLPVECKERALCCWALLRSMHLPARLVVGIELFPLTSHCWCELGNRTLCDAADKCGRFTPVLTYG